MIRQWSTDRKAGRETTRKTCSKQPLGRLNWPLHYLTANRSPAQPRELNWHLNQLSHEKTDDFPFNLKAFYLYIYIYSEKPTI